MAKSGAKVTTVDIKGEMPEVPYENITFINQDSKTFLPYEIAEEQHYDIVFIDGDHSYEGVKEDIKNCKMLADIIVCHDYGNLADVTQAIDEELAPTEMIICDRMWKGAPYENGIDKGGNKIDYGIVIWQK